MQKMREELNENPVGGNCIRPHFEEMSLKNQKGITLIALIITIIVMLILVGVTINVALNGGLFDKATQAKEQTTREAEIEALSMAAIAAWDVENGVNWEEMQVPAEDFELLTAGTYKSKKSGKTYKVDKATAKVTEGEAEEVDNDLAYVKAELEGKKFGELIAGVDENNIPILKNNKITIKDVNKGIFLYNGKEFTARVEEEEVIEVYYFLTDANDYFIVNIMSKDAIIIGLTEKGSSSLESTKKLIIPKEITGTDGRKYKVIAIGDSAFEGNTNIEQLIFESGIELKEIGENAFWYCTNITGNVIIPDRVTKISHYAFAGCTSINNMTIDANDKSLIVVERDAFSGWTTDQTIYMKGRTEAPATVDNYSAGEIGWDHNWNEYCKANIVWDK